MLRKRRHTSSGQALLHHLPVYFWRNGKKWLGTTKIINITKAKWLPWTTATWRTHCAVKFKYSFLNPSILLTLTKNCHHQYRNPDSQTPFYLPQINTVIAMMIAIDPRSLHQVLYRAVGQLPYKKILKACYMVRPGTWISWAYPRQKIAVVIVWRCLANWNESLNKARTFPVSVCECYQS